MNPGHSRDTRDKIGRSKAESAWRRQAANKTGEAQSSARSAFEEDFATPRASARSPRLWEEQGGGD